MPLPRIYLIPGLGADHRLMSGLKAEGLEFEVLEFIPPRPKEDLSAYALRLAEGIDQSQPFIVGGVSLGGMLAVEISKVLRPEATVLISSLARSREFPFYFKLFRFLPVQKLMGGGFIARRAPRSPVPKEHPAHAILRDMRLDADPTFVKWALNAVIYWRNKQVPEQLIRIHGSRDPLLPPAFIGPCTKIPKGNHVMVITRPAEVYQALKADLEKWQGNFVSS